MKKIIENLPIEVTDIRAANGGDVNEAYKVYSEENLYFMLVQKNCDQAFYHGEIAGLKLFEKIGVPAPRVIDYGFIDGDAYLLLSYLDEGSYGSQSELARIVAKIHKYKSSNNKFGFDYPHRGSQTTFSNNWSDDWAEVFLEQRMIPLADQIMDRNLWTNYDYDKYQKVHEIMEKELAKHRSQPSLLHGDLWAGNYMFLKDGSPALFDPSPFYGDREFDIGIITVFGGFTDEFYEKYNEIYPLDDGYRLRLEFYRLYLYMVHLVKFGNIYEPSVNMTMENILGYWAVIMTWIGKSKEQILDFVQGEYNRYTGISYIGQWESYDCYEIKTDEDTDGVGAFALVNEDGVRLADSDEDYEIVHFFSIG